MKLIRKWDRFVGGTSFDDAALVIKVLYRGGGRHIDLHRIAQPDPPGRYHTHPANAYRLVLSGGYVEEVYEEREPICCAFHLKPRTYLQRIEPGHFGLITPSYCHRIHALLTDRPSYSLWFRGKVTAKILFKGWGWPPDMKPADEDDLNP